MKKVSCCIAAIVLTLTINSTAFAETIIGSVHTTGTWAKTKLSVIKVIDPDYHNIVCYTTQINVPFSISDPSSSSIDCVKIHPFKEGTKLFSRKDVFSESKGFFKTMHVTRMYDKVQKTFVYLSYTRKWSDKSSHSHSIAVVPVH